ncbi:MAG: FG-GAP-like repeat-containing protein [Akkermansiaceae bacterium]|nr:FG-GAP-like repeat-containing protein [Akkermansiaceae bacterium]
MSAEEKAFAQRVENFCSSCHGFTTPDSLPKLAWAGKIELMYEMMADGTTADFPHAPDMQKVIAYYEKHAPRAFPPIESTVAKGPGPLEPILTRVQLHEQHVFPSISQVDVHHFGDATNSVPRIVFCDMVIGAVGTVELDFVNSSADIQQLVSARHPAHAEMVDLDKDGLLDILVSDLGTVNPSDAQVGSLEYFRKLPSGNYDQQTLIEGVGRISEARAADFDSDGDLDIICAIFGWRKFGGIVYLENEAAPGEPPSFKRSDIDPRPGAINLPICDLDGDGRLDFIALVSQHHESIYAYLNRGPGNFEPHLLYRAPHANWGSVELELVDLDQDGDLDLLYAHGDTLDDEIPKPYHGVSWLENRGSLEFHEHPLTKLYGAYAARAGDFDGDDDLDIAISTFLPFVGKNHPAGKQIESLIWLEQKDGMKFQRHSLEASKPYHPCLATSDLDGDGRDEIIYGNMTLTKGDEWRFDHGVGILRNTKTK